MGFLKSLWGKSPEDHEKEGDSYFAHKSFGSAKLQYESALEKLLRRTPLDSPYKTSLEEKIAKTNEALARIHLDEAIELIKESLFEDALDLLNLVNDLTQKDDMRKKAGTLSEEIHLKMEADTKETLFDEEDEEEQFNALIAALPETMQNQYLAYGTHFKEGYIALNKGAFEIAREKLSTAKAAQTDPVHHIDFELASACINTNQVDEAEALLKTYITHFPKALPAYQFICELYWEKKDYTSVTELLGALPEDLKESEAAYLLSGENNFLSGKLIEARKLFERFLNTYGWSPKIGLSLGKVYEKENNIPDALRIYQELMNACQSCGSNIDPFIKRKFADLSFQNGERGPLLLEMYLSLTQEDPDHAASHYRRVSELYEARGYEEQARHFSDIADKIGHQSKKSSPVSE